MTIAIGTAAVVWFVILCVWGDYLLDKARKLFADVVPTRKRQMYRDMNRACEFMEQTESRCWLLVTRERPGFSWKACWGLGKFSGDVGSLRESEAWASHMSLAITSAIHGLEEEK